MKLPNDLINEFLRALNRKMTGIHVEERRETGTITESIAFQCKTSNIYCRQSFYPSQLFYDVVNDMGKKYFGIKEFTFNNTGNIFWFYPKERKDEEVR